MSLCCSYWIGVALFCLGSMGSHLQKCCIILPVLKCMHTYVGMQSFGDKHIAEYCILNLKKCFWSFPVVLRSLSFGLRIDMAQNCLEFFLVSGLKKDIKAH